MSIAPSARFRIGAWVCCVSAFLIGIEPPDCRAAIRREEVEKAIREGVRFLKDQQRPDGSWADTADEAKTGTTSLVTLALLTAGRAGRLADDPARPSTTSARFGPEQLRSTYAVALQTMVFAAADPERDQLEIAANVAWLERAQIKAGDRVPWPGSWTYSDFKERARRQLEHPVRPARPERRQRGRRRRSSPRSGPWPGATGSDSSTTTGAGRYTPDAQRLDRQHDLRGDLQPDHHRPEAVPGPGVPRRRPDPELRRGGRSTPSLQRGDRLARPALPGRPELRQRPAVELSITSTAWSAPAGSPASGSSASTTGTARGPRSWSTTRTSSRGFWQGRSSRTTSSSRPASPSCSWPRGGPRS